MLCIYSIDVSSIQMLKPNFNDHQFNLVWNLSQNVKVISFDMGEKKKKKTAQTHTHTKINLNHYCVHVRIALTIDNNIRRPWKIKFN